MSYDVDYFIQKFEAIPPEKWGAGSFNLKGRSCTLGHCGVTPDDPFTFPIEADKLSVLFSEHDLGVMAVNDCMSEQFSQRTPRARILAALKWIKERTNVQD